MTRHELSETAAFIARYATVQLGSGIHTSRVVRNARRVGKAVGVEVSLSSFQKNAILSVSDNDSDDVITRVVQIPELPISFSLNTDLSALSWAAADEKLTLDQIKDRFESTLEKKRLNIYPVTLCVALANAAFCRLFGGDFVACVIVFFATLIAYYFKMWLTSKKVANYIVIAASALIASAIASLSVNFNCTANIALATSPLFLVPGVPLINGFMDIVEGHVLIGMSRLVNALLSIVCIAVGLSITLAIIKNQLL